MKKLFGYTRVSTAKQGEHGVSLQEQRAAIESYAKRSDVEITTWFEERETAAKRGRKIFNQMLKLLRQGKAEGVIMHKIDRSARNLKDWADLGELIDGGIDVRFANESLDMQSRGGRLSADIQAVVAADYIRNLREESRKGFYGRIKQGVYPLPAPLGYLNKGSGKPKELDPEKAPLVKQVFELYASGKYGLRGLAKELYSRGLRSRKGGRVCDVGLSRILNNPFYIGLIRLKTTGEIFQGVHEPLISKSIFDRTQQILTGKVNAKIQRHDFLFRRLLSCKSCGYALTGDQQKHFIYYRCHNTERHPANSIREEKVNEAILARLLPLQFDEEEKLYLNHRVDQLRKNWKDEREEQIKIKNLNLNRLQERLGRLTDAYVDRLIDKDLFEERKTAVLMEKKSFEEKLASLKSGVTNVPDLIAEFLEMAESAYLSYEVGSQEEKRDLLEKVTSNRIVEAKNVMVELKIPFHEVANRKNVSNGHPSQDTPRTYLNELIKKLTLYFSKDGKETQG